VTVWLYVLGVAPFRLERPLERVDVLVDRRRGMLGELVRLQVRGVQAGADELLLVGLLRGRRLGELLGLDAVDVRARLTFQPVGDGVGLAILSSS
jgi:hypothetical protein